MPAVSLAPGQGAAESPVPPTARRGALFAVWGVKAVASIGRTVTVVALPWFVLQLTGSGTRTGLAVACSGLGAVFAFTSGAFIDRSGAKRTSVVSLVVAGAGIGLVPLLYRWGLLDLWPLLALVFLVSALDSVTGSAVETLVPDAVRAARTSLESANAVLAAIDRFALLIMPVVAGVAIAIFGVRTVILVDTVACVIAALLLAVAVPADTRRAATGTGLAGYLSSVRGGLGTLWHDRVLRAVTVLGTSLNALVASLYSIVLLAYAARVFGDPLHFAGMIGAAGAGSVAGALLYALLGRRLPRRAWLIASCLGTAAAVLPLAAVPGTVPTLALIAVSGVAMAPLGPLISVLFQERTPAEARGRVISARNSVFFLGVPAGGLLAGVALDLAGLGGTILLIGLFILASAAAAALLPALRQLDPPAAGDEPEGVQP